MRPSLAILLVLGALTLGLRLATGDEPPRPAQDEFQNALAADLQRAGFATRAMRIGTLRAIEARRADCSLSIGAEIFHGVKLGAFAAFQPDGRKVRIYYHGWQQDYPRLRALLSQYVNRYLSAFGIDSSFAPVILLAAEPRCDLRTIPLADRQMRFVR